MATPGPSPSTAARRRFRGSAAAAAGALRRLHHRVVLMRRRLGSHPHRHLLPQGRCCCQRLQWVQHEMGSALDPAHLPQGWLTARRDDCILANDAALLGRSCERNHVPVVEFKENLRAIVNHLKDCSKSMVILLITPPPVDEDGRERFARSLYGYDARRLPERTNEMAGVYAGQCIELAKEMGVHCIDIWSKMQAVEGWQKLYLSDGLHLTPEGNALVHKEVVRTLRGAGLRAEVMPLDFPHHSKIDATHPGRAFQ